MKRGYLNTDKAKLAFEKVRVGSPLDDPKPSDILPPRKPVVGAPFVCPIDDSVDLHTVPPHIAGGGKERTVFLSWPRDPLGKPLTKVSGKRAANAIPTWGATLYDFYQFTPIPSETYALGVGSSSQLSAAMRQLGEERFAVDQMECAACEADPREVPVADITEDIKEFERRVRAGDYDEFSALDDVRALATVDSSSSDVSADSTSEPSAADDDEPTTSADDDSMSVSQPDTNTDIDDPHPSEQQKRELRGAVASVLMSDRPISSPFHPTHYPPPWPLLPFASPDPPIALRKHIPIHLLPKTLYVHGAYNTLLANKVRRRAKGPWQNMSPLVYEYILKFFDGTDHVDRAAQKQAEEEAKKKRILEIWRFMPTLEEYKRGEPILEVPLPTRPPALTQVDEAHLYISGDDPTPGSHSEVYNAIWELPRGLLVEPDLCSTCVYEEVQREARKLKKTRKWRAVLLEHGWQPPVDEVDLGDYEDYEYPVPPDEHEQFDEERIYKVSTPDCALVSSGNPEGLYAFRVYCPNVRWQDPCRPETLCEHRIKAGLDRVPRTAAVQVVAKLSHEWDNHTEIEAKNYERFPEHFFQNWNGYNIVHPIKDPVPIHAIVPQCYGFYVCPEGGEDDEYLSPILLLEHSGSPIMVSKLSRDEREECASVVLRFHRAGWKHASVYERNILQQRGLPTESLSFRLIDFGRSSREDFMTRRTESDKVMQTLRLGQYEDE